MPPPYKRSIKLIQPRLQLKLVGGLAAVALLALLLQYLLFMSVLTRAAVELPNDGLMLMDRVNGMLLLILGGTCFLLMPIVFWVGIVLTHRIAGPVYRLERFLTDVRDGKQIEPCRLRKGDELQGLCTRVNEATEPVRAANAQRAQARDAA